MSSNVFMVKRRDARLLAEHDERVSTITSTDIELRTAQEFAADIAALWHEAQQHFLAIGRRLMAAKEILPHGEYERMISAELPFSKNIAHQLKAVAEAIGSGRLLETELPRSYSSAYHLTTLSNDELEQAHREGLVSPQALRSRIIAFKQRIRNAGASLAERRLKLERRRDALAAELKQVETELANLEASAPAGDGCPT